MLRPPRIAPPGVRRAEWKPTTRGQGRAYSHAPRTFRGKPSINPTTVFIGLSSISYPSTPCTQTTRETEEGVAEGDPTGPPAVDSPDRMPLRTR